MRRLRSFVRQIYGAFAILAAFLLLLVACSTSPPVRFYTLCPVAAQIPLETSSRAQKTVVGIGPVEIPDYLDRPQIVTRSAQNRLSLSEFDLWGGSLKSDINQVLVENLCALLPPNRFSPVVSRPGMPIDYRVALHVIRLDVKPGEGVVLGAQWSLSGKEKKEKAMIANSSFSERTEGSDLNAAVAAMSRAVGRLSEEMAARIEETATR